RLDATVVQVAAAVEDDGLDAGLLALLRDELADLGRLLGLVPLERLRKLHPGRRGDRFARAVVDERGVDALVGPEHGEPRPLGGAGDLAAHALVAADARLSRGECTHARFPTFRRTYSPS